MHFAYSAATVNTGKHRVRKLMPGTASKRSAHSGAPVGTPSADAAVIPSEWR
jgi:hypothetical protein